MAKSKRLQTQHEIAAAVEQLVEEVQLLRMALDDVLAELQWRNNQADRRDPAPFVVTSLPLDPAAKDWHINRCKPEDVPAEPPVDRRGRTLFDK